MQSVVVIDPRLGVLVERAGGIESAVSNDLECILGNANYVVGGVFVGEMMGDTGFVGSAVGFAAVAVGPRAKFLFGEGHREFAQRTIKTVRGRIGGYGRGNRGRTHGESRADHRGG